MKALKTLFLTVAIAVGLANSTKAQNTYTLGLWGANDVSNAAVSGTSNVPMDSLIVNVGDNITFYNMTGSVQSFNVNAFQSSSLAFMSTFTYVVTSTDVPDLIVTDNNSVTSVTIRSGTSVDVTT